MDLPVTDRERGFYGVNDRLTADLLPAGVLAGLENGSLINGEVETRGGVLGHPAWSPAMLRRGLAAAGAVVDHVVVTFLYTAADGYDLRVVLDGRQGTFSGEQTLESGTVDTAHTDSLNNSAELNDGTAQAGQTVRRTQAYFQLANLEDLGGGTGSLEYGIRAYYYAPSNATLPVTLVRRCRMEVVAYLGGTQDGKDGSNQFILSATAKECGRWTVDIVCPVESEREFADSLGVFRAERDAAGVVRSSWRPAFSFVEGEQHGWGVWGAGWYRDAAGRRFLVQGCRTGVWLCRGGASPRLVEVPEPLTAACSFGQLGGRLFCYRGEKLVPWFWDGDAGRGFAALTEESPAPGVGPFTFGARAESVDDSRLAVVRGGYEICFSDLLNGSLFDEGLVAAAGNLASERVVRLWSWRKNGLLVFKEKSIHLMENVAGDLSDLTSQVISRSRGLVGPEAVADDGRDVYFLDYGHVWRLSQVWEGSAGAEAVPLSYDIEGTMRARVNWAYASGAVLRVLGERLFCAVPVDGSRVNNAVLVYHFPTGQWHGVWTFSTVIGLDALEVVQVKGQDRLLALDRKRGLNVLLEDQWVGDCILGSNGASVVMTAVTRRFTASSDEAKRWSAAELRFATINPLLTVATRQPGVGGEALVAVAESQSATQYWTGAAAFVPTNENNDHMNRGRRDYRLPVGDVAWQCNTGVVPGAMQEWTMRRAVPEGFESETMQLRVTNASGRARLRRLRLYSTNGQTATADFQG